MENINFTPQKKIENLLLVMSGLFLPLITLRIELPFYSMSFFLLSCIFVLLYNYRILLKLRFFVKQDLLIFCFLLVTLISTLYSIQFAYGIVRWVKLFLVIMIYFGLRTLFIKKWYYVELMMRFASIMLAGYLLFLIWFYVVRHNLPFIGINTHYPSRAGKNSLSFMVVSLLPFSLYFFFTMRRAKVIKLLILTFLLVCTITGAILIQSRAMYLILITYTAMLIMYSLRIHSTLIFRLIIVSICIILLARLIAPQSLVESLEARMSTLAFVFGTKGEIFNVDGSFDARSSLIEQGIKIFTENPFLGTGMGSFMFYEDSQSLISHNDYILVMSEQGLVGIIIFIFMIFGFLSTAYRSYKIDESLINFCILMAMTGISIYFLFINAYDHIFYWLGAAIVSGNHLRSKTKAQL